jgi:transposase
LRGVERPARMVYEAGPAGYGLARRALAEGIELGVCAPSKTERPPADRVKTDKSAWTAAHPGAMKCLG